MFIYILEIYQDIINKDNYKLMKVRLKHLFIRFINTAGAFVNPNGITKNS